MYTPIDQNTVDEKIHRFMASKSPWKTFSKTIADRMASSVQIRKGSKTGISYEPTDWTNNDTFARSL